MWWKHLLLPLILLLWHYDPFSFSYGPARFFQTLSNYWIIDILRREAKCSNLERQRARGVIGAFRHDCVTSLRNLNRWCADSICKNDANFVSSKERYKFSFALIASVFCVLLSMSLSADNAAPPLQRIIAIRILESETQSILYKIVWSRTYDQHSTHARNKNTLCASLTMRREIVATRRAGVATSVLKEVAPKGEQRMMICRRR